MPQGPPRRRRARPVADAPVDAVLAHADEVTKGWLFALLEQAPLAEAPAIVTADLAREGPMICAAIVRALAGDADLRLLEPDGPLEPLVSRTGSLAGAQEAEAISRAVDALGAVVWSALREELSSPDAEQLAELAQRLARVMELVRGAALRRHDPGEEGPARATGPGRTVTWPPAEAPGSGRAGDDAGDGAPTGATWMGALEDELERAERKGTALSLLLVELEDAERVPAAEGAREAAATFGRFAQAVRGVARRQDVMASESDARVWLIARDTGRRGAQALGERIARAARGTHPWRGAPLMVNVGVAVLGEDGHDAGGLIDAAERAMFAAAARGN
jgi:GGDEF domain-containing protein